MHPRRDPPAAILFIQDQTAAASGNPAVPALLSCVPSLKQAGSRVPAPAARRDTARFQADTANG